MEELRNKIFKILQEEFGEYSHFEVKQGFNPEREGTE